MKLPIADCRLPIWESLSRRSLALGRHDCGEFVRFGQKCRQFLCWHDAGLGEQFEPQRSFISLFLDNANLGDKFRLAARAATRAIIRRHGSSTTKNLFCDDASCVVALGNFSAHLDDSQGKCFGSRFHFSWSHGLKLRTQSAIGNRQSAIPK